MKKLLRNIYYQLCDWVFGLVFWYSTRVAQNKVCVLDIDNTIADTWRTLHQPSKAPIPVLKGTYTYLQKHIFSQNYTIIYLSHRPYSAFGTTYNWLKNNNFPVQFYNLFLVKTPFDKLKFLKKLSSSHHVVYFDDLSRNHENGEIIFYDDLITQVKALPLTYYDFFFIQQLNDAEN